MIIKGNQIQVNKETAFRLIDCRKDNPIYAEMEEIYEELLKEMDCIFAPQGVLGFATALELFPEGVYPKNAEFAMVLYTLGGEVGNFCSRLISEGEYLKGMLADAMADSCLFTMEKEWKEVLVEECRKKNRGIAKRMEAPTDFSMEIQKRIWQLLDGESIGVTMTSGYMFSPVKTICLLFELTDDICRKNVEHKCSQCTNLECKLRNVK